MKIKVALLTLLTLGTLSLANATSLNFTIGEGSGAGSAAKNENISGNAISSLTISEFVDYSVVSSGPAFGGTITATPNAPALPDGGSTIVMLGVALCGLVFMAYRLKDTRVAAKRIQR